MVDEGSLASTVQARDLLRIANALRIPRVVLVGDAKQLDAVDAGKPFAQLQAAGMQTATMDEIMRQRDPALKEAVEASLKGDIERAFEKLGSNVAEVKPDNIAGAVAARWLRLDEKARANTGVMAPSHELRRAINGHIRERLAREGRIHGPAMESERLVSRGYTSAEKALAANYAPGDVVAFHRAYKRIGVGKGDERRVMGVDRKARAVLLDDGKGSTVAWKPGEIGGHRGGSEVYRREDIELRAGDRIRWTHNDAGLGLVNSRTAEVLSVGNGKVTFELEDGKTLELGRGDPQLRPPRPCLGLDRARLPGPHRRQRDRRHGGPAPAPDEPEELLRRDQPRARPGRAGHRRRGGVESAAPGGHRRAHRRARRHRRGRQAGEAEGRRDPAAGRAAARPRPGNRRRDGSREARIAVEGPRNTRAGTRQGAGHGPRPVTVGRPRRQTMRRKPR